jgi:dihydroorotase
LHVLHLSTAREMTLFSNSLCRKEDNGRGVCTPPLVTDADYARLVHDKVDPAVKGETDRDALRAP